MGQDLLLMSFGERRRMAIMEQLDAGGLTLADAARRMGVGYRQAKRIRQGWLRGGAVTLIHGLRGRVSNRRTPGAFKRKVLDLYRQHYWDFGPTLACEKLCEVHGLDVVPETLRRWLHGAHLYVPRRAARQHRKRRKRRERFGSLVQIDGSHHGWFEQRAAKSCLMVMVDDATGTALGHMGEEETTRDAYEALKAWIERHGVPAAIYADKKSVFFTTRRPTEQEKRQGSGALTDFGRACWGLNIEMIPAHSPQAKGRVERKNGVLQDRLVKELRLQDIDDIDEANAFLPRFFDDLNRRQARPAASPINAHRRSPSAQALNDILCREQTRTVQNDWTVRCENQIYQIHPQRPIAAPGQTVTVRRRLDNTLAIVYRGQPLEFDQIKIETNQDVIPPLGAGRGKTKHQTKHHRGHFYCAQEGDISTVA